MRVHISLPVNSLSRSEKFYAGLFGQSASKVRDGYANFRLDEPPIHLALVESSLGPENSASHFGIELPDIAVLEAWRSRLEAAGVSLAVEDEAQCCYAKADKLWLTDPDGNPWEVWVRTGEHDAMGSTRVATPPAETKESCCCA